MTRLDLADQAVVTLQVQPKAEVSSVLFQTSAGPLSKFLVTRVCVEWEDFISLEMHFWKW